MFAERRAGGSNAYTRAGGEVKADRGSQFLQERCKGDRREAAPYRPNDDALHLTIWIFSYLELIRID